MGAGKYYLTISSISLGHKSSLWSCRSSGAVRPRGHCSFAIIYPHACCTCWHSWMQDHSDGHPSPGLMAASPQKCCIVPRRLEWLTFWRREGAQAVAAMAWGTETCPKAFPRCQSCLNTRKLKVASSGTSWSVDDIPVLVLFLLCQCLWYC